MSLGVIDLIRCGAFGVIVALVPYCSSVCATGKRRSVRIIDHKRNQTSAVVIGPGGIAAARFIAAEISARAAPPALLVPLNDFDNSALAVLYGFFCAALAVRAVRFRSRLGAVFVDTGL